MQQRRLRAELRRLRDTAGHTQKFVAESLGWSVSKVIRIETGAVQVSTSDVRALLHFYGVTDQTHTDDLLSITRSRDEAWWDVYRSDSKPQFLDFLDYENSASKVRQFISFAVPGLLQTEAYMRTLFEGYLGATDRIERGVEIRKRRQNVLADKDKEFWFVIDEGALHRWIGGPEVTRQQLDHLRTMAKQPNISVRIVPFSVGMHPGLRGSFTIFEFPSEDEDLIVNLESAHSDAFIRDDVATASEFIETFFALDDFATSDDEFDEALDAVIDRMRLGT